MHPDVEVFLRRLRESPALGERERVAVVRETLLRADGPLRSAPSGRLMGDMDNPVASLFHGQEAAVRMPPDVERDLLHRIVAEGRRRQALAAHDGEKPATRHAVPFGFRMAVSGLVLLVAVGTTLTVAAESSIPGDTLYPVKIAVVEPIVGALQLTPQADVSWATRKTRRRLQEVVEMQDRKVDDPEALSHALLSIEDAVRDASAAADDVSAEDGGEIALDAHGELESVLDAHEVVLTELRSPAAESVRRAKLIVSERRRVYARRFIAGSGDRLSVKIQERVAELQEDIGDAQEEILEAEGPFTDEAMSLLQEAQEILSETIEDASIERPAEAFEQVEEGLRYVDEALELLETQETLDAEPETDGEDGGV